MIDKIMYKFFGFIDKCMSKIAHFFEQPKKTRKRRKCRICKCSCHCTGELHLHWYDGELCTCDTCKH